MKETYEQLKMDVVVFDADIRTATDGVAASAAPAPVVTQVVN